ncbi:MAG: S41 family peptidase [Candidatus Omnitrophota bacterium]
MTKRLRILLAVLAAALISSIAIGAYDQPRKETAKSKDDLYAQVELFADAISVIRSGYVDEVESKKLIHGALRGMLGSLDDFSEFMEPDEFNEMQMEAKGEFGGIGIEVGMRDGVLTVIAPIAGTPAEEAGIKPGDRIVRINGKSTKDMTLDESVKTMRGEPGTPIALTIWREKDEKAVDLAIKRDIIKIHSIKNAVILEDGIGYVKIAEFQENTPRDLETALKKLEAGGMNALILDLRNNPGGLLETAVEVSEKFLPKDTPIVSIKGRAAEQNTVFRSSGKLLHPDYPVVILVNEGSASASEVVGGALQDNKRAIIMGMKTFGKGSVQTVIPLRDGSALRLTTASYFTPGGRMIRNQGVIPDVTVEWEDARDEAEHTEAGAIFEKAEKGPKTGKTVPGEDKVVYDSQLKRAVDLVKALKIYRKQ